MHLCGPAARRRGRVTFLCGTGVPSQSWDILVIFGVIRIYVGKSEYTVGNVLRWNKHWEIGIYAWEYYLEIIGIYGLGHRNIRWEIFGRRCATPSQGLHGENPHMNVVSCKMCVSLSLSIYIYIYVYIICLSLSIYIYRERERYKTKQIYIYIYICMYILTPVRAHP